MRRALAAGLLAVLAASGQGRAGAQAPVAPPEPDIVVTGSRDGRDPVAAYVEAVTLETAGQLARFEAPVCPLALGLPRGHGEAIEARLRQIAEHLGIGSGGAGCRPSLVVIVAEDGGDFLHRLRRDRPDLFDSLELADVRDIMRLPGPVRAWQVVEPRGADGRPLDWIEVGRERRLRPSLAGVMPSLTSMPTRQDLTLAFIVFDLDSAEGLTLLQIADHAAMRAFARTAAAPLPPGRSILTLFADAEVGADAAEELTGWDAAYLRALYRTGDAATAQRHRSSLARAMRRDLESPSQQPRRP